ncbi:MAG: hypothetical protein AVDCRST_MAG52-1162 [uncultured Blastococcus sp.]|uniref:Amino acid permease n=1 Tax=uncultured Blastococcus sp. TaxID=217144 RepID=A0A6J4HSF1_9ACTN|nr:MAG: hypothetical protein AVDCRST_MAG52-1162 [uncultured Blastococcus sp.]
MEKVSGSAPPGAAGPPVPAGGAQQLKREFSLWSVFALGFAFISPIVAVYGIFAFSLATAGPAAFWGFVAVLVAQLLVACVFAELASRWPLEGGLYEWSRRLMNETYGWFAGWALIWTLMVTMTAVAYGAAGFVPAVLGIDPFEPTTQLFVALGLLAFGTGMNLLGRLALKVFLAASIGAEVIGSLGIGTWLLFFHREQPIDAVFDTAGAGGSGGYLWGGFIAAAAFIGYAYVGFDAAASVAEETTEPRRDVPKAIVGSLLVVGAVVVYSTLGLILAIPDFGAVISGEVGDPVVATLTQHLGTGITKPLFGLFILGFVASLIAIQTSCSRVMWAFARAGVLPASAGLRRLSTGARIPSRTILTTFVISSVMLLATRSDDVYATLVSMATGGFYLSFAVPVLALTWMRLTGRWVPGPMHCGRWGTPIAVTASVWVVFEYVNIAWPRLAGVPWYEEWAVLLITGIVLALGLVVYLPRRSLIRAADQRRDGESWTEPEEDPAADDDGVAVLHGGSRT